MNPNHLLDQGRRRGYIIDHVQFFSSVSPMNSIWWVVPFIVLCVIKWCRDSHRGWGDGLKQASQKVEVKTYNLRQWLILHSRIFIYHQIYFKATLCQSMHAIDKTNKGQTLGTFFSFILLFLIPRRNDYNKNRQMIWITYRDKGRNIGGNWNSVIRNSLPQWLCQGTCLPTNE